MTTIAIRDGVMAADSQVTTVTLHVVGEETHASGAHLYDTTKLHRFGPHAWGLCGNALDVERFREWLNSAMEGDCPLSEDSTVLFAMDDGTLVLFEAQETLRIETPYYAIGSGHKYAMGAMAAGASAKRAVKAAKRHDCATGGKVRTLRIVEDAPA